MWSWRNPPKLDDAETERKASWLELFYDLVYIATVITCRARAASLR